MPSFPVAPKRPHTITQHGQTRVDDYFWLRQREDPEVLKYLTSQMDYLEEVMGHTKPLQERLFSEMKARIQETDSTVPEERGGYWYYTRTEAGKQARHTVRLAWSNERVLRRSLMMLNRLGDRAGALRQYEVFLRRLKRELEAEPSKETADLVEAIRNGTA